jgi:hypothetical protein
LCTPSICNLIASLQHHPSNLGPFTISSNWRHYLITTLFRTIVFLVKKLGKRYICSRCPWMDLLPYSIWSNECKWVMIYKMRGWCLIM